MRVTAVPEAVTQKSNAASLTQGSESDSIHMKSQVGSCRYQSFGYCQLVQLLGVKSWKYVLRPNGDLIK